MNLTLKWHDGTRVQISAQSPNDFLWNEVRSSFPNHEPMGSYAIVVPYHELIATWTQFWERFSLPSYDISFTIAENLQRDVRTFMSNQQNVSRDFSQNILIRRLAASGFVRKLTDFQVENVCKLSRRNQGATFSVPGAGKTTEALAFFFATSLPNDRLLVVAPLNAFGAWDEQIVECTGNPNFSFVRLTGGAEVVRRLLMEDHRFMLTNYEVVRSSLPNEYIRQYLTQHPETYVFLDESHKIKNDRTALADAIRLIQCLPKAKLIMSGTPMPQSPRDLLTQYRFLFPNETVSEDNVIEKFKNVYVRTTATRLGITPIKEYKKQIELNEVEREVYKKMRKLSLNEVSRLTPTNDARYLRSLGKCIMRLMAFISNPALIADRFSAVIPELPAYLQQKDSQKIAYVCNRARELAAQNIKVLIWSSFVRNVELIASRLRDVGADYIHGGVKAGDVDDPTSREGKIKRFHESDGKNMVLVANPAAASEGISLHKACQYAIYLDRTFNAAHYLQSRDRIHRLGLPQGTVPEIELVICPNTIDELVHTRLNQKILTMAQALDDPSIIPAVPELLFDEDDTYDTDVDN